MLTIVGKFLDKSARKMFKRFITLSGLGRGSIYPKFGNLGIIGGCLLSHCFHHQEANLLQAITYSVIAPLVLGFATIGFFLIYLAVRYNSFYVLTNNIDTKGAAYAKALQQLMTGVYLSEICLIGLFAINAAPGPIVLMAVFLGATIFYHILMRQASKPLMVCLPDDYDNEAQTTMFSKSDHKSYDAAKAGVPPSEAQPVIPKKMSAKKAGFFSRIFDIKRFKNFNDSKSLVPNYPTPQYEEESVEQAYFNPAVRSAVPKLWIVRDDMGISRREVMDNRAVVPISDEFAWLNEKGKIVWDEERVLEVPVWEKRIEY
jgi:calcium permeable stress-gated cation channel